RVFPPFLSERREPVEKTRAALSPFKYFPFRRPARDSHPPRNRLDGESRRTLGPLGPQRIGKNLTALPPDRLPHTPFGSHRRLKQGLRRIGLAGAAQGGGPGQLQCAADAAGG